MKLNPKKTTTMDIHPQLNLYSSHFLSSHTIRPTHSIACCKPSLSEKHKSRRFISLCVSLSPPSITKRAGLPCWLAALCLRDKWNADDWKMIWYTKASVMWLLHPPCSLACLVACLGRDEWPTRATQMLVSSTCVSLTASVWLTRGKGKGVL